MTFLFMLIGAVLGAFFCADVFDEKTALTAMAFGLVCGLLFGQLRKVRARVKALETELKKFAAARVGASDASAGAASSENAVVSPLAGDAHAAPATIPASASTDIAPPLQPPTLPEASPPDPVAATSPSHGSRRRALDHGLARR